MRKVAEKATSSSPPQLTKDEIRALKAFAQALMKAKFEKGGMTDDDWDEMFAHLPVARTQFEDETFEFGKGGRVELHKHPQGHWMLINPLSFQVGDDFVNKQDAKDYAFDNGIEITNPT